MEPAESGTQAVVVINQCPPDRVPAEWIDCIRDELEARGQGGGILGSFPLIRLKVTLLDVETDDSTNEVALRIAAGAAFEKGLQEAQPVLLEPVMKLQILTPEEHMGDFVGDLQQRRGVISRTEGRGKFTVIEAEAPLAELFGYSSAMRSLSQGRASCAMQPMDYAPAPPEVAAAFAL
jgi:elongation factor G